MWASKVVDGVAAWRGRHPSFVEGDRKGSNELVKINSVASEILTRVFWLGFTYFQAVNDCSLIGNSK